MFPAADDTHSSLFVGALSLPFSSWSVGYPGNWDVFVDQRSTMEYAPRSLLEANSFAANNWLLLLLLSWRYEDWVSFVVAVVLAMWSGSTCAGMTS